MAQNFPSFIRTSLTVDREQPGPDAYTVVPDSSLVVARTAYRNNSSRYTINGDASTFTKVQSLLKGKGIDLDHKRFLILQVSACFSRHFHVCYLASQGRSRVYRANEAESCVGARRGIARVPGGHYWDLGLQEAD